MGYEREIELLESEWAADAGFFFQLREGRFDPAGFRRALQTVSSMTFPEHGELPRRLISLLWYIPLFMQWQVERVQMQSGATLAYQQARALMVNQIERLLGVP